MMGGLTPDDDLAHRLPLPLAQIYRRANNAKTPLDRHNAAYCLWEASLKLLGSVAIVAHAERGAVAPELVDRLQNLARPALGHWWEFVRLLVPPLADSGDAGFRQVRDLLLGRPRDGLPRAAGLVAALRETQDGTTGGQVTVHLSELFERMVRYRNQELAHGAPGQRDAAFYDRMGRAILLGAGEILGRLDVLAGRRLLYVADVRRQASGHWLVERYELAGESFRRLESIERPESEASVLPHPGRLYLDAPGNPDPDPTPGPGWSLHPLVLVEFETAEVFFLNSRRGRRRTEYLGYHPGRVVERTDLGDEQRELLARVLGMEVDPAKLERWAASSQAEDPPLPPAAPDEAPRRRLGEFELLSELGRGGMGVVYRAWQPSLGRQVALKCLLKAGDSKADARFNREIHALGRVEHPNLVKVFTSGVEADRWFYAMELVDGATLAAICGQLQSTGSGASDVNLATWHASLSTACQAARDAERPLSTLDDEDNDSPSAGPTRTVPSPPQAGDRGYVRHVVELLRQVADAAHALHEGGVIHRDIKPENILVGPEGTDAVLMDLGLAQLADESTGRLTRTRQFVGTLRYASPEQVLSVPLDRRSDVYSLGATLWELLTLRPLFGATESLPTPDLMLMIQHTDPDPPRRHNPQVPQDLEAIVLKCLEKDRARRYATASDLAADLSRWMRGEPVLAQPPTLGYLLAKAIRRNRVRVALISSLLLAALLGSAAVLIARDKLRSDSMRSVAENALKITEKAKGEADLARTIAEKAKGEAEMARDRESNVRRKIEDLEGELHLRLVQNVDIANGFRRVDEGDTLGSLAWFADALRLDQGDPRREKSHCDRLALILRRCPRLSQVIFHDDAVMSALFSPDGRRVVTASHDNMARVWDAETGQPITPPLKHAKQVNFAAFSPDGRRVVTASRDNTARVWDTEIGQPITPPLEHGQWVNHAAFSPDGRRVVTASFDHTARMWDAGSGQPITPPLKHQWAVQHAVFSPDGRRVVTASEDKTARVWDAETGQPITPPLKHEKLVSDAEFSPDGRRVVTASEDNTARVWDAGTGQPITPPLKHDSVVYHAEFSPDGRRVVTASEDKTARVWDAGTGQPTTPPLKHDGRVRHAAFSPDGRRVVTASHDQTARVWDAETGEPVMPPLKHEDWVQDAEFSPDGRRVVTASEDKTARVWDAGSGQPVTPPLKHDDRVNHAAFSPDSRRLVTANDDKMARVWDAETGEPITPPLKHAQLVNHAAFSPDGRRVVTASYDKTARVWDAGTGQPITPPLKHLDWVNHAAFSPDGRRVVTASQDKTARVWDAGSGQPITPPLKHDDQVNHAAFSPDGRRLVTATDHMTARVWDAETGQPITPPLKHEEWVTHQAFSPDGRRVVVTTGHDHTARVWDVESGQPVTPPLKHDLFVKDAEFSPDGRRVVTASFDHTARVWDAGTGQPITPPLKHDDWVSHAAFSPDGRRVVTTSGPNASRVWDIETGQPIALLKHEDRVNLAEFSPDGLRVVTVTHDTVRVWDLPISDDRESGDWIRLAQMLAGTRIDRGGETVPLTPAEFRNAWRALRQKYPSDFVLSPREVLAWHRHEAKDCEAKAVWSAAITHLDALIAQAPGDGILYERRGDAYAERAQWDRASADFSKAVETQPGNLELFGLHWRLAYVALAVNDTGAYRRACARLLDLQGRPPDPEDTVSLVAFAFVLAPDAVADREAVARLAQKEVQAAKSDDDRHALLSSLGAATYRAGRFEEAVKHLNQAIKAQADQGDPLDWLFLALAHQQLHHTADARQWLDKAAAWIDSSTRDKPKDDSFGARIEWGTWLILQVLRREGESLVKSATPAAAPAKP